MLVLGMLKYESESVVGNGVPGLVETAVIGDSGYKRKLCCLLVLGLVSGVTRSRWMHPVHRSDTS